MQSAAFHSPISRLPPLTSQPLRQSSRPRHQTRPLRPRPSSMLAPATLANAAYQLEELEGGANAISSLYLSSDGSVTHAASDGPVAESVGGEWVFDEGSGALTMQIERRFSAGVGFTVTRVLRGDFCGHDGFVVFEGSIFERAADVGNRKAALGCFSLCKVEVWAAAE